MNYWRAARWYDDSCSRFNKPQPMGGKLLADERVSTATRLSARGSQAGPTEPLQVLSNHALTRSYALACMHDMHPSSQLNHQSLGPFSLFLPHCLVRCRAVREQRFSVATIQDRKCEVDVSSLSR